MSNDKVIPFEAWNDRWKRRELLTRRPRVRRLNQLPWDFDRETQARRRYPHSLGVLPGYQVSYRRGGWRKLETMQPDEPYLEGEEFSVRIRETFAWIESGGRRVGAVSFQEIDAELVPSHFFWTAMDDESAYLSRVADVLASEWEYTEVDLFAYGPVLELREVWVEPRHQTQGIWKPVAKALIAKLLPKCSILFVHAYPLEYSGMVPENAATEPALRRRRDALVRVGEREFGLTKLPGEPGDLGFLWRPRPGLEAIVDEPEFNPDWMEDA